MRKKLVGKSNTKDKTGQRIGSLTVLGPTDQRKNGSIVWKCQCDCGNICYIPTSNLSREHTTSCGCQQYKKIGEKLHLKLTGKRFGKLVVLKELPAKIMKAGGFVNVIVENKLNVLDGILQKVL